ncbi:MAG: hypothetical protein V9G18_09795 [Albidovulum sp.]|jgi:hypothetical protein
MMAIPSAKRSGPDGERPGPWRRLLRAARALDDHWIGDLIGAASLFATLYVALVAGWALQ